MVVGVSCGSCLVVVAVLSVVWVSGMMKKRLVIAFTTRTALDCSAQRSIAPQNCEKIEAIEFQTSR